MKKLYAKSLAFIAALFLLYFFFDSLKKNLPPSSRQQQSATGADRPGDAAAFEILKTREPLTGEVPRERLDFAREIQRKHFAEQLVTGRQTNVSNLNWTERGPDNVGGRTRAILYDQNDPASKKIWAAGVGGGLWYTNDITAPTTAWTKVSDALNNLAISCITQGKSFNSKNKLFFGTGEGWGNRDAIRGNGIWRSLDGGATWIQLPSTIDSDSFRYVQDILYVDNGGGPCLFNGPALLAATRAGVFRSINDGDSWTKVLAAGVGGASIDAAADLEAAYYYTYATLGLKDIGGGGIYRSCDAGETWVEIYDAPNTEQRIEIATHYLDAWEVYAVVQGNDYKALKIMKSSNADAVPPTGVNWVPKTLPAICGLFGNSTEFTSEQAWYDLIIEVAPFFRNPPVNDHHVTAYVGGIDLHKTTNSGSNWAQLCEWKNVASCSKPYVHADKHNLVFKPDPVNAGYFPNEFLVTSDGGIHRSTDGGATYTSRNKSFNVTQLYSCAFHPTMNSNYFLAGSQDNNTQKFTSSGMNSTTNIINQDSDGGFCFIDQNDPTIQIAFYYYLQLALSTDAGNTFATVPGGSNTRGQFVNPADYDPSTSKKVLYAGDDAGFYFRWTNPHMGGLQEKISVSAFSGAKVTFVKLSPNVANRVYFGLTNGSVVQVDNADTDLTKTGVVVRAALPSQRYLSCIDIESGNENHMLISYSNYGVVSVYESSGTAGSLSWDPVDVHSLSYPLPDMPIRWCMFDPRNSDWAILATEMGVWSTANLDGESTVWQPSNNTMANTRVDMLRYRSNDRLLLAATHGRGLFSTTIPAGAPLPLTLTDFKGSFISGEIVLDWKTLLEQNTEKFEIEKSANGIHFKKIGEVKAAGTSQRESSYHFIDKDVVHDKNFYRLKLVDRTGKFELSHVVLVRNLLKGEKDLFVLTNPFRDYIEIEIGLNDNGNATFRLMDVSGKVFFNKTFMVNRGARLKIPVNTYQMASGVYVLECILNGKRYAKSLLKR